MKTGGDHTGDAYSKCVDLNKFMKLSLTKYVKVRNMSPRFLLAVLILGFICLLTMTPRSFSKFYRRHYELISKFIVGLKSLLHQGLSEPEFNGDLVYKFKKIRDMTDFSDQFRKKYNALQTYWL